MMLEGRILAGLVRRRHGSRQGGTALEVLFAAVIGAILACAIVTLMFTGSHEAMVSEDYMFAEALAQRYLAETMAVPWSRLEEQLPLEIPVKGVPAEDGAIALARSEYARNLEGTQSFDGKLQVKLLEPGLMAFEISLEWPVRPGATARRRYALIRLRCRKDIALSTNHKLLLPQEEGKARDT